MTEEKNEAVLSPKAELEKTYINEYLRENGYSVKELNSLPDQDAKRLMIEACQYAAFRLEELESQARLHTKLHEATESS
jgi:hypothetical protein